MSDSMLTGSSVRHGHQGTKIGQEINPTVMIGLGGTGKNILQMIRRKFFDRFGDLDNFPLVSYAFIDTDRAMRTPLTMDADIPKRIEPRPEERVEATVPDPTVYTRNLDQYPHIKRWFSPALSGMFPINDGAGGIRQKSRLAFYHNFDKIEKCLRDAKGRATDPARTNEVAHRLNMKAAGTVQFFIVTSLAGGTGSGCFLDVAFLIQDMFPECRRVGYLITADIFGHGDNYLRPNTYAALRELEHFSFISDFDYQWKRGRPSRPLPMHAFEHCFLIGNQNRFREYPPDLRGKKSLFDMTAEAIFQEFGQSDFASIRRGIRVNLMSDQEKAFHLTDVDGAFKTVSDAKKDQFPEIYATFGLSILRVPIDRIKKCCAYRMAREVTEHWKGGGGGGPAGQVQLRDFVKQKLLANLELLEERGEAGRHDLLNRLYVNPQSGTTLLDEVRAWVSNLRQYFNADDVRTVINREIKKFRTEKFADGGHYLKQMADNRDAIIERLKSDLKTKVQDLINREGMAASADQILKEIVTLVDDPQDAYLPYLDTQGKTLEKLEKRSQKQYESQLEELVEVTEWRNPLKLPFRDLAAMSVGERFLQAVRDHFVSRVKTLSRRYAQEVLIALKNEVSGTQAPRHFVEFLGRLADYLGRMKASYERSENLLQVQDLYREEDVDTKYFPLLFGADNSSERGKAVTGAALMILDTFKSRYPTIFDSPQPLRVMELQGERGLEEIGDDMADALGATVRKLDDQIHIAREISDRGVTDATLTEMVHLADPWLKPESGLPVDYRLDPGLTKFVISGKDDEQRLWQGKYLPQLKSEVASIHTGSTSETPAGDRSQVIIYSERARFPLFYTDIVSRYRQEYNDFRRAHPDWPLHLDVGLDNLRQISLPTREERERERRVRKALLLARIFKDGLKTERSMETDGSRRTSLVFEYAKPGSRHAGVKEIQPLGPNPEVAVRTLMLHDEAREAICQSMDEITSQILNSDRWPEFRALLYWFKEKQFPPETVEAMDAGNLVSQQQACLPERIIIEKDLEPMFNVKIRHLQDDEDQMHRLSEFTARVQSSIVEFEFTKEDPTQQDFTMHGNGWRTWVRETPGPAVDLA